MRGRLAGLARRLAGTAALYFVDAPHALPPLPRQDCLGGDKGGLGQEGGAQREVQEGGEEREAAGGATCLGPRPAAAPRRTWLLCSPLEQEMLPEEGPWAAAGRQTEGAAESLAALEAAWRRGPSAALPAVAGAAGAAGDPGAACFDGVLGFSQGAGLAAALCAHLQSLPGIAQPRFCVCVCGFVPAAPQIAALLRAPLRIPSLHIFGGASSPPAEPAAEAGSGAKRPQLEGDRHVGPAESLRLAACFRGGEREAGGGALGGGSGARATLPIEGGCSWRQLIRHAGGHHIPIGRPFVARYIAFLSSAAARSREIDA